MRWELGTYRLGSPEDFIAPVIKDLRRCALLRDEDHILSTRAVLLRYANVIFDLDRDASLKTVHGYLGDIGIAYCGRYGDWGYMWTDESFKSGENAATKVLSRLHAATRSEPATVKAEPQPKICTQELVLLSFLRFAQSQAREGGNEPEQRQQCSRVDANRWFFQL